MRSLNERNTQYKIAKRYGMVTEQQKPVIFYFEQYKKQTTVIASASHQLIGLQENVIH